jgi:hypothetical protein
MSTLDRKSKYRILAKKLDRLALSMERAKLNEYVNYLENPKRMFFANFLAGIARGFGASMGFTLLAAVIIYILQGVVKLNLPIIGKFISDIVNIVNNNLRSTGR